MSEITVEAVMKWMEVAKTDDLGKVADALIERDFAADPDAVTELEHELARRDEQDEQDDLEPDLIGEARDRLRRREYREALHVLSLALGPDFDALDKLRVQA